MAQCNNIYLDQNLNSANSANSLTYVPLIFFYGAVSYVYYKFISYIRQQEKEHDYAYTYQEDFENLKTQFLQDLENPVRKEVFAKTSLKANGEKEVFAKTSPKANGEKI